MARLKPCPFWLVVWRERSSAERNPAHADEVVMNGPPGWWATRWLLRQRARKVAGIMG